MEYREFEYVGKSVPKITKEAYDHFLLQYQKSILMALSKQNILTLQEVELCMEKINERDPILYNSGRIHHEKI